jgi:hypothetical protein
LFHFKVRKPTLTIDLGGSQFTSQSYDYESGQYVFTVEQGTLFHLSYGANTYTTLSASDVELYRDREHLRRGQGGTITLEGSYMRIRAVNRTHQGAYTIRTSSGEQVSFQLKVKGMNEIEFIIEQ